MTNDRIVLRRLVLTGDGVPDAVLGFEAGLNVISGASDTGKSYVFGCLDYMMGGSDPPKPISEAAAYTRALLEIETSGRSSYTLARDLSGGEFLLYASRAEGIDLLTPGQPLRARHDANDANNISRFLLSQVGVSHDIRLKKNQQNDTQSLSFRNICSLVMASESRIIDEASPIYSGHSIARTADVSAFLFVLLGHDASSLLASGDIRMRKAQWLAQYELYGRLIEELDGEIAVVERSAESVAERLQDVDERIEHANERLAHGSALLEQALEQKRVAVAEQQNALSRIAVVEGLLARFDVLRRHYESDLERLRFVAEGSLALAQVHLVPCPVCGMEVTGHQIADGLVESSDSVEDVVEACRSETGKIHASLHDLTDTTAALRSELEQLLLDATRAEHRIEAADVQIHNTLQPLLLTSRQELDELAVERRLLAEYELNKARRTSLIQQRFALGSEPRQTRKGKTDTPEGQDEALEALGDEVKAVLREWEYGEVGKVAFDKDYDLILGGVSRRSHGKGIRAIIRSAFMIALMRNCIAKSRPHPGFVVLDSPLTTYRGAVSNDPQAGDVIPSGLQGAFFRTLAMTARQEQVIILDNKEPPDDLKPSIHYVQFTGQRGVARQGFFPRGE